MNNVVEVVDVGSQSDEEVLPGIGGSSDGGSDGRDQGIDEVDTDMECPSEHASSSSGLPQVLKR